MITIRRERCQAIEAVRRIHERAFGQVLEAGIVDRLRQDCPDVVSLVAEVDGTVAGHILFSPVVLRTAGGVRSGMGLGPMAVDPACQTQGIGSALVRQGLALVDGTGCPFVVVLGHPSYYPRFGFEPAVRHGIRCTWDGVPDEAFMIRFPGEPPADVAGVAIYRDEFPTGGRAAVGIGARRA